MGFNSEFKGLNAAYQHLTFPGFGLHCSISLQTTFPSRGNRENRIISECVEAVQKYKEAKGECLLKTRLHESVYKVNVHASVRHRKNILIYIQVDATLHSLFYLETALHVSVGTTTHHQERKQLHLKYLVSVRPLC